MTMNKYLLLTEFKARTVSYGPSFFLLDLYLYCVSEGLRNDSYSRGTASNFWRTSKAKLVNIKLFLSRWHALIHDLEYKKCFKFLLAIKVKNSWR